MSGTARVASRAVGALAASLLALAGLAVAVDGAPISSSGPPTSLPEFRGHATTLRPTVATIAPQNPFMAPNPNSNIHNDTWMTDAYRRRGPLGISPLATSEAKPPALCGSLAFDRRGRIATVCPSLIAPPQARIIDPHSLATIATY